jgi:hypothetical protein
LLHRYAHAPWWVHTLATLGAVLAIVLAAAAVSAFFFVDFVSERTALASGTPPQTEITGTEAKELATRFAPELRYQAGELFKPIPRAAYLSRTQLKVEAARKVHLLRDAVQEADLPDSFDRAGAAALCLAACFLFLDVRGVEPHPPTGSQRSYAAIGDKLMRSGTRPTVYYHVTKYDDTGEYAIQYWFLYLFNYRLNEHESDWEQITLRLNEDKQPIDALYSAHEGSNVRDWSAMQTDGDHPVVYSALGSHANYFRPGHPRVEVFCQKIVGRIKQCIRGRKVIVDLADGNGDVLKPGGYDLAQLAGPVFIGSYGSGNYVALMRKADVLRDPRLRPVWRDPLASIR